MIANKKWFLKLREEVGVLALKIFCFGESEEDIVVKGYLAQKASTQGLEKPTVCASKQEVVVEEEK